MYLYGKNSILERLKVNPKSIECVYIKKDFKDHNLLDAVKASGVQHKNVTEKELEKIKRADRLQGIVALVEDFKYTSFEKLIYDPPSKDFSFIFIDSLNDPHNLGSIIRIAACFGNFGIVIPKHKSCQVNDTVMHVASGGENYVPVSMVTNMTTSLLEAKKENFWIVGTIVEGGEDVSKVSLPFPLCLVLGSEGTGIRYGIKKHLDLMVKLPMKGAKLSFNVAMASAIFCHEIARQRSK